MKKIKPVFDGYGLDPNSPNKTFCTAPWTHTYISPQSERRMCCASREKADYQRQYIDSDDAKSDATYNPATLKEHWNSEHMKSVRRRMLAGETLPECQVCNEDVLSLSPYRQWFNSLFRDKIDSIFEGTNEDGATTLPVISFDYRISNLCNFKCRMCGEQLSSSWEAEKRKNNMWSPESDPWMIPEVRNRIQEFQVNVVENELRTAAKQGIVEELYWVGGEPLMWDTHWDVMKELVESGNSKKVYARYNTNLSKIIWNGTNLFDLLPHFKDYLMCCSIDGIGKHVEFIRTGIVWDEWLDNFKEGCKVDKEKMKLDLTLTLPGLFCMKEFFDLSRELDVDIITKITFAFDPQVLMSPLSLPRNLLNDVVDDILNYTEPRASHRQMSLINTLKELKTRKNFEEQWPESYQQGFKNGKAYLDRLAKIRKDGQKGRLSMEDILSANQKVLQWWNDG